MTSKKQEAAKKRQETGDKSPGVTENAGSGIDSMEQAPTEQCSEVSVESDASDTEVAPPPLSDGGRLGFKEWWSGASSTTGDGHRDGLIQLFLILGAAFVYLPNLNFGLWDCWEPHYAEAARMMVVRKDWLHPFWSYAYFLSKPILMFWYMAASMSIFGVHEWAIRLPFVLHAILLIWSVYFFISRLFTQRAGLISAIAVGTAPLTVFLGRQSIPDILVTTYVTMALGFLALALFGRREERETAMEKGELPRLHLPFLYLFYALLGLALLAKGLLGAGLVGVAIVGYILLTNDWRLLLRMRLFTGLLVTFAIALPWYLHMLTFPGRNIDDGKTFFKRFILHDNFYRLFRGVHGGSGHFAYFIRQLGYAMGVWVGIVPIAAVSIGRWKRAYPDLHERLHRFLFAWWFFLFLFFSFSQTKFHHYVFPLVPISGILVGIWLDRFLKEERNPLYDLAILLAGVVFLVVVRDVLRNPHHLINMFVYKYSRPYPWSDGMYLFGNAWHFSQIKIPGLITIFMKRPVAPFAMHNTMAFLTFTAFAFYLVSFLKFFHRRTVVGGLAVVAILWSGLNAQHWMPTLANHWSQRGLFETLKKDSPLWRRLLKNPLADALQEKVPDEPLFAFRMNWRGEKFYSRNRDIQIMGKKSYGRMYDALTRYRKPGRPVYFLIEATRMKELRRAVGYYDAKRLRVIDRSNNKYRLVKLLPKPPNETQSNYQLKLDSRTRKRYDDWNERRRRKRRRKRRNRYKKKRKRRNHYKSRRKRRNHYKSRRKRRKPSLTHDKKKLFQTKKHTQKRTKQYGVSTSRPSQR